MQALCRGDNLGVGRFMNLETFKIGCKVEAYQGVQFIHQIRRIGHRRTFLQVFTVGATSILQPIQQQAS